MLTDPTSPLLAAKYGRAIRYTANPPTRRAKAINGEVAGHWDAGPAADWCEVASVTGWERLEAAVDAALASLPDAHRIERQAAVHAATPCTRSAEHWPVDVRQDVAA